MHISTTAVNLVASANVVEKSSVVQNTRYGYTNKLVELILWLFDNGHQGVLTDTCQRAIRDAAAKDMQQNNSTRRRRRGEAGSEPANEQRKAVKALLLKVNRQDSTSSPIRLEPKSTDGEDDTEEVFSYKHVVKYFTSKQKIEIADLSLVQKFKAKLRSLSNENEGAEDGENTDIEYEPDENGKVKVAIRLEATTYDGYRSAISFLYRESGVTMPNELSEGFTIYIKGSRRINLAAKQTLGLKITEGKRHMTPEVYKFLAKTLFESPKPEHVFAHTFLVLDWNLMKRAENCVNANISHVSVRNDSLVFEFAKSKGNQDGEEHLGPWHVYANPFEPTVCPLLALPLHYKYI